MKKRLQDRSTGELVVLMLGSMVVTVIFIAVLGTFYMAIFTDEDWSGPLRTITGFINSVIGGLIGYIAGSNSAKNKGDEE